MAERLVGKSGVARLTPRGDAGLVTAFGGGRSANGSGIGFSFGVRGDAGLMLARGDGAAMPAGGYAPILKSGGIAELFRIGPYPEPILLLEASGVFSAKAIFTAAVENPDGGGGSFDTNWWWM